MRLSPQRRSNRRAAFHSYLSYAFAITTLFSTPVANVPPLLPAQPRILRWRNVTPAFSPLGTTAYALHTTTTTPTSARLAVTPLTYSALVNNSVVDGDNVTRYAREREQTMGARRVNARCCREHRVVW